MALFWATGLGVVAWESNLSGTALALALRLPGDFLSLLTLVDVCYASLHVLRHFVHWNSCIKAMCSTVLRCDSLVFCNSVVAGRSGTIH